MFKSSPSTQRIADLLPRFELSFDGLDAVIGGAVDADGNEIAEPTEAGYDPYAGADAAVDAEQGRVEAQPQPEPDYAAPEPVVPAPDFNLAPEVAPAIDATAVGPTQELNPEERDATLATGVGWGGDPVEPPAPGPLAPQGVEGQQPAQDPWAQVGLSDAPLAFPVAPGPDVAPGVSAVAQPGAPSMLDHLQSAGGHVWDAAKWAGSNALGFFVGTSAEAAEVPKHLRPAEPALPAPLPPPAVPGVAVTDPAATDAAACYPRVSVMLSGVGVNHGGVAPLGGVRAQWDFNEGQGKLATFGGNAFTQGVYPIAPGPQVPTGVPGVTVGTQVDARLSGWGLVSKDVMTGQSDIVGQGNAGLQVSAGIGNGLRVAGALEAFVSHREGENPGPARDSVGLRAGPNISAFGVNGMLWGAVEFDAGCAGAKVVGAVNDFMTEATRPAPIQPVASEREVEALRQSHETAAQEAATSGQPQATQGWTADTILRDAASYSGDAWMKGRSGSYGGFTSYPVPGTNQRCQIPASTAYRDNPQGLVPYLRQCGVQFPR